MAAQDVATPEGPAAWVERARMVFGGPKPARLVACGCAECRDHQQRLSAANVETVTLADIGHSALHPLNFASPAGQRYFFPALVRLALHDPEEEILQALVSVLKDKRGGENKLWDDCTALQRSFVADFLGHLIETHAGELDLAGATDELLRAHERWSGEG